MSGPGGVAVIGANGPTVRYVVEAAVREWPEWRNPVRKFGGLPNGCIGAVPMSVMGTYAKSSIMESS
jgi:hypothetical protein